MPSYYPQGSLVFARDPTGAHESPRPVIVISDVNRPYVEQECTVVCLSSQDGYSHAVTHLPQRVVSDVRLKKTSYIMPWAIYTIPTASIDDSSPSGTLTTDGLELVADAITGMIRP
jgi:mRNA-degrading endonuclease toxin of MazEF toxin-antitoxin module